MECLKWPNIKRNIVITILNIHLVLTVVTITIVSSQPFRDIRWSNPNTIYTTHSKVAVRTLYSAEGVKYFEDGTLCKPLAILVGLKLVYRVIVDNFLRRDGVIPMVICSGYAKALKSINAIT